MGVGTPGVPIDMYGFGEVGVVVPLNDVIPTWCEFKDYWSDFFGDISGGGAKNSEGANDNTGDASPYIPVGPF